MELFLVYFSSTHVEFRVPEVVAVARLLNVEIQIKDEPDAESPFMMLGLHSIEDAKKLASRSVTIKAIYQVWGHGKTYPDVMESIKTFTASHEADAAQCSSPDNTYKFVVDSYGRKYDYPSQLEIMKRFKWIGWKGKIRMKNPKETFWILEFVGKLAQRTDPILYVYFARQIGESARGLVETFTLKKRNYLGTTSMDNELSLISANQGQVKKYDLVLDPFVGTGSLLIPCAHFGAMVFGTDIDIRVLRGTKKKGDVKSNFVQYKLTNNFGDIIRNDNTRCCWRNDRPIFDAIICDPPYGVRAGAKKVGWKNGTGVIPDEHRHNHMSQLLNYTMVEVLKDLLYFASYALVTGGRLVYWLPTTIEYKPSDLPTHPMFDIIANSEQVLSGGYCRRLITMQKKVDFSEELYGDVDKWWKCTYKDPIHWSQAGRIKKEQEEKAKAAEK